MLEDELTGGRPSQGENQRLHDLYQAELFNHGIIDLITQHADSPDRGLRLSRLNLGFKGEPVAKVDVLRTKQEEDVFYGETVEVSYDGTTLSVEGAHPTYQGPIQTDGGIISEAIRKAFDEDPKRTIITDFDPRKYIY